MNDLSSLDWNGSKASPSGQQSTGPKSNYFPTLRPTPPVSGRSTPSSALISSSSPKPMSNTHSGSRGSTPANDSFANLVSFNTVQPTKNLSLQEQQQKLKEEKARQEAEIRKAFDSRFGTSAASGQSRTSAGDIGTTPNDVDTPLPYINSGEYRNQPSPKTVQGSFPSILPPPNSHTHIPIKDDEDDILAAFNASAPVDMSSHMPAPSIHANHSPKLEKMEQFAQQVTESASNESYLEPTDDPFGLGMGPTNGSVRKRSPIVNGDPPNQDDDDVLGMLSRPVSEFPKTVPKTEDAPESAKPKSVNPKIRALNELVDMGFEPAKCRKALDSTESGIDVQAAVGWLLNQAHEASKNKKKADPESTKTEGNRDPQQSRSSLHRKSSSNSGTTRPVWMKEQASGQRRKDSKSPTMNEKDPAQYASELGSSFLKTANSLWKSGQKKLNQAVSELNSADYGDPSQPKWMRDASHESSNTKGRAQQDRKTSQIEGNKGQANLTNEAMLLDAGGGPPARKKTTNRVQNEPLRQPTESSKSGAVTPNLSNRRPEASPQPKFMQEGPRDQRSKLSRQAVEEEAAGAYISPARRKKAPPRPQIAEPEPNLLFDSEDSKAVSSSLLPKKSASRSQNPRPIPPKSLPTRPSPPKRSIPPVSSISLQSSTASRKAGTEAFKRGDYGSATVEYTKALTAIPPLHPLTIVILTNRALSHSKMGDSKASIADATTVIDLVGPSRGVGETIDLGDGEATKQMDTYWGKAMQRKAEGLEQLEHWSDAATAWRSCVEFGVGGASSIAGRNRCENAARPKPPPATKKPPPRPKPSALGDLAPASTQSTEAVSRLRAANAAADKLDDEKFRLADIVDGRVSGWRAGKEANLRALLASLENVLWEDAGWKRTGMGELIQPNKVKIVYMRGIAKVHPDKLPTTATTEQRMISAAVFATLNEAWEKFKTENNL